MFVESNLEKSKIAEESFVSCFLTNGDAIKDDLYLIDETNFTIDLYMLLYKSFIDCSLDNKPINLNSAKLFFPEKHKADLIKLGLELIQHYSIPKEYAKSYAKTIKELWTQRFVISSYTEIENNKKNITQVNQDIITILSESSALTHDKPEKLFNIVSNIIENQNIDYASNAAINTKLNSLNQVLGNGLQEGGLYIIAGRPAMGKSAFATSVFTPEIGSTNATLFFSLEMTKKELSSRILSEFLFKNNIKCPYKAILSNKVNEDTQRKMLNICSDTRYIPFIIDDNPNQTINTIKYNIKKHIDSFAKEGFLLKTIVIDHIGLINPDNRYYGNKVNEIGQITKSLKQIAKELNVAIVALCQLNRNVEKQDNKRPQLSDLRGSGDIEQDANVVIALYRDVYYSEDKGTYEGNLEGMEAIVLKNRNGELATLNLYCNLPYNSIMDLN